MSFDQPVVRDIALARDFLLDGEQGCITSGSVAGNVLTLQLNKPVKTGTISYLNEMDWSQDRLLLGANGTAALTFCAVAVLPAGQP